RAVDEARRLLARAGEVEVELVALLGHGQLDTVDAVRRVEVLARAPGAVRQAPQPRAQALLAVLDHLRDGRAVAAEADLADQPLQLHLTGVVGSHLRAQLQR